MDDSYFGGVVVGLLLLIVFFLGRCAADYGGVRDQVLCEVAGGHYIKDGLIVVKDTLYCIAPPVPVEPAKVSKENGN